MVTYETVDGKRKCVVSSKTIAKGLMPWLNRKQRRDYVFAHPVRRLMDKIYHLREDMIGASLKVPSPPKFKNSKYLSGYMSQLLTVAKA